MADAKELKEILDRIVNEHYLTPEIARFNSFSMTLTRAGVLMIHRVHYTMNRRDCWASVQSNCPMDVKRLIWAHEKDELVSDARFGGDHHTAEVNKAMKLTGLAAEAVHSAEIVPGCKAAFRAWLLLSRDSSWLKAFSASAVLERANNNRLVKGGGSALRDYQRYTDEVKRLIGKIPGHDVHNVADEEHSDMMEVVLDRYAVTEEARRRALEGARESLCFDRAYRGALAVYLEAIPEEAERGDAR
jgi:pyrroloquinoline quinone (PQQ) biosynthesis protein C